MKILKRSGAEVNYDGSKIVLAVQKAMAYVGFLSESVSNEN